MIKMEDFGTKPLKKFVNSTDFERLANRKAILLEFTQGLNEQHHMLEIDAVGGIINWIDTFQDMLVDEYKMNPKNVYHFGEDY